MQSWGPEVQNLQARLEAQLKSEGSLQAGSLLPAENSGFSSEGFQWIGRGLLTLWREICFTQRLWISVLITSKKYPHSHI